MTSVSEILSSDWVHRLGWALLHSFWQIAALAAVLAILLAALRRRAANTRYVTACAGLLVMLVLPVVTYCLVPDRPIAEVTAERATSQRISEPSPPPAEPSMADPVPVAVPNVPDRVGVPGVDPPMVSLPSPATPLPERVSQTISPWMPWLAGAWFVGVFVLSLWHLGGWIALQRLKHLGTTPAPEPLAHRLAELIERMQLSRPVRMLQSAVVDVAAVIGWLRPVLLVPAAMLAEMSPQQIDAVLAHELAHIRRYDYLVNLLQTVVETLLFYHPAVWWLSRRIRIEREHCCDDAAVAVCGSKLEYAEALKAVEQARAAPRLAVAVTGADDAGTALGRVRRVLGLSTRESLWSRSWLGGSAAVLLLIGLMLGYMATAGEPQGEFGRSDTAGSAAQRGFDNVQQGQLQQLWSRIGHADPQVAHEAMQAMAAEVDSCVAFLRRQIEPMVAKANQADLEKLIAELDDDRFDVRQQANRQIGLLGPWAAPRLRAALPKAESAEQRHRLAKLIRAAESPLPITPAERQMIRAVEVLGLIGTDEARTLLKQIESSPAKPRATYVPSPVSAVLLARSPIRSLEEYHHVIRTDPAPRPPLYKPLPVPECDLEIRRAKDQARVARIPYKAYFHDNGRLSKSGRRRIGQLPDGKYLIALCIGNGRCSNVAAFEIDSAYDSAKQRSLRLEAIEKEPWQTLRYLGVRGTGPTPRDPKFDTSYVHCPVLTVDGAGRSLDGIKGSFFPIMPGKQFDSLVDLSRYGLPITLDKPHTIKANSGQYESNTVRISLQRPLGEAWDQATPDLPAVPPPTVALRGKVIGSDGKLAEGYEVGLSQMDGTCFREKVDVKGCYEFVNVPAGTYELACNPAGMGQPILVIRDFLIEGGKTRVQDLGLQEKFIISGKVTDADGRPVSGMTVDITCEDSETRAEFSDTTKTDAQGRYRLGSPMGTVSYLGINGKRVDGPMPQLKLGENSADYILKNIGGKHPAIPAAPPAEEAAFGPVTERTVAYREGFPSEAVAEPGPMYLDLDTGAYAKFKALPDSKMTREAGVDVYYEPRADGGGMRLATSNLQLQPLSGKPGWNSSPAQVYRALIVASPYSLKYPGNSTLAVKTGDGGIGILQIVGFTKDRHGIRIRYKLLQRPKAGRSATAPARQPAEEWGKAVNGLPAAIEIAPQPKFALFRVLGHRDALPFGGKEKSERRKILFSGVSDEGDGSRRFDSMRPEYYPLEGLILDKTPLLTEADLAGYDWPKHEIHLKPGVRQRLLRGIKPSVWGVPFAVVADGESVYLGAFWTGASSYSANMPTISVDPWQWTLPKTEPNHLPENAIRIENNQVLKTGEEPRDPRANPRLRQALDRAGKLIDLRPGAGPKRDQPGENEIPAEPATGGEQTPWGKAVEGVQCRLRPDKHVWREGEDPTFKVDLRNQGVREMKTSLIASLTVEVDGDVFTPRAWHRLGSIHVKSFGPGAEYTIEFPLSEFGSEGKRAEDLSPGKHTVRAVLLDNQVGEGGIYTSLDKYKEMALAFSNPVEIEIVATSTAGEPGPVSVAPLRGRVLDHRGNPVQSAKLFLGGGKLPPVGFHDGSRSTKTFTDKDGRFVIDDPDTRATHVLVAAPSLYVWQAPLPQGSRELEIRLPQPATLKIRYDIQGADQRGQFRLELMAWKMEGWKGLIESVQNPTVPNKGEIVLTGLTPGRYDLARIRHLRGSNVGQDAFCDRRLGLELSAGQTAVVDFVRPTGHPLAGQVVGLPRGRLGGAFVYVRDPQVTGDPKRLDEWMPTTFDGAVTDAQGRFTTARIPPGTYNVIARSYDDPKRSRRGGLGWQLPDFVGAAKVTVPPQGQPPEVRIEMKTLAEFQAELKARQAEWGPTVEGVQVRLRAAKSRSNEGRTVRLWANVRNQGSRNLLVTTQFNRCELEVDGRWYRRPQNTREIRMRPQPFPPGRHYDNIGVDVDPWWELASSQDAKRPRGVKPEKLKLTGGKHTIRVAFRAWAAKNAPGKAVQAVSNPVVIEVISAKEIAARPERLKSQKNSFELRLAYHGPRENPGQSGVEDPIRSLILHTTLTDYDLLHGWSAVAISEEQAARIIDHLREEGFLSNARSSTEPPRAEVEGPAYRLTVFGPDKLVLDELLGWDLKMLRRLDALRKVLEGNAAKAMDKLLAVLEPNRKQWETTAAESVLKAEANWGEAVDVVQVRATVDKKAWRIDEGEPRATYGNVPLVRVEVRVSDAKQFQESGLAKKRLSHAPSAFALEIDGRRYDNRTMYTARPVPLMQPFKTALALDETWTHNGQPNRRGEPLEWKPGKHTVRVLFTGLGQSPAPASRPLEIEILPAENKLGPWNHPWGEPVQGVQLSAQPVQAQWPLGSEPALRTRIRNTGDQQWTIHKRPYSFALEIDGKQYTDSHGYPTWKVPLKRGDEYEVTLKLNKMWWEGERGQYAPFLPPLGPGKHTVRVTLTELGRSCRPTSRPVKIEILGERTGRGDHSADDPGKRLVGQWVSDDPGQPEKHTFEAGGNYTLEKPGEGPQRGNWRLDGRRLVFQLAEKEHTHEFQWWGPDKIRVFSEDSSARRHLLRIDPRSGKVIRWGEMISGVMARLDPERLRWPESETPALRLLLHQVSFGELLLSTVQMPESRLEVDGKLYRHPQEEIAGAAYHRSLVWMKHMGGRGPEIVLDTQWQSVEGNEPLQLAAGKHAIRYGWAGYHQQQGDPTKVDKQRPVVLWSGAVEIEIVADGDDVAADAVLG